MSLKSWIQGKAVQFMASTFRSEGWEISPDRRRPPASLISADSEYNLGRRERMMAEARALCQTFGIANNILGKFANYCVGRCTATFNTGLPEWDTAAEEFLKRQFEIIDYCSEHDLQSMAKLALRSKKRDGDIAFIKTKDNGWPQLQAIEADRIRSSSAPFNSDTQKNFIGGVSLDRVGRPISYRIWERRLWFGFENPQEVAAENILFWKERNRFDATRGITCFERGALNRLRDIKEIIQSEAKAVKVGSKFAILINRQNSGVPTAQLNLFREKTDGTGFNYTEEIQDGMMQRLLLGEEAKSFESNRPSPTFQGFMEFLIRDISISLELPVGFVWSLLGLTGPSVRLESKQAERTFQAEIDDLERNFLNPLAAWVLSWGMMEARQLPFNPNWYKFRWSRPAHPSIDVGRESKADLDELSQCITSGPRLGEERGYDIYANAREQIRFVKYVMDECDKQKVPFDRVMCPPARAVPADPESDTVGGDHQPQPATPGRNNNGNVNKKASLNYRHLS